MSAPKDDLGDRDVRKAEEHQKLLNRKDWADGEIPGVQYDPYYERLHARLDAAPNLSVILLAVAGAST